MRDELNDPVVRRSLNVQQSLPCMVEARWVSPDKAVFIETRERDLRGVNIAFVLAAILGGPAALLIFLNWSSRNGVGVVKGLLCLVAPTLLFAGGWLGLRRAHRSRRMLVCLARDGALYGHFVRGMTPSAQANDESNAKPIDIQLIECRAETLGKQRTFHGVIALIDNELMPLGIFRTTTERDSYAKQLPLFMRPGMRRVDTPIEFEADIKIFEPSS